MIGTKIQTLRKNKNITQAQLAEVLAVSSQSVSKWENKYAVENGVIDGIEYLTAIKQCKEEYGGE